MTGHGYVPYTKGCRCEVCRAAKRAYVAERRKAGTEGHGHESREERRVYAQRHNDPARGRDRVGVLRYVAPTDRHGTPAGYDTDGCRCWDCTDAATLYQATRQAARHADTADVTA